MGIKVQSQQKSCEGMYTGTRMSCKNKGKRKIKGKEICFVQLAVLLS